jgi:parvulin-like peptidyl-prolyl isomerase
LAKKQKKTRPERTPTKHQLSKWQRQERMRRIVIIAATVFLVGIGLWVGISEIGNRRASNAPLREVMIEVNGVPFTMEYFLDTLDIYVGNYIGTTVDTYLDFYMQAYNYTREEAIQLLTSNAISDLSQNTDNIGDMITDQVADDIVNAELMRQGAEDLGIEVTTEEIEARLTEYGLPNDRVYQDLIRATLLQEKLGEYFDPGLNATMEQAHVQVMLVESEDVTDEVISRVESGSNFTALVEEFSCNSTVEGDLGWLPGELMPTALIANAAFNLTPGETIHRIYDKTATKNIGYWLIEVTGTQNATIDALVMLLGSQSEAERVKAELADGGDFSTLAETYSQHESKTNGGKLDGLSQGDIGSIAFDSVAFNLTINEVSEPVKDESVRTIGGYWLVRVVDRGNRELGEEVRQKLIDKHFNDWFEEWSEQSTIEINLDAEKKQWAVNQILAAI